MCLFTIPAAEALLTFAGLESPLSIDYWHLPTAPGAAWARRVTHLSQGHMSLCFAQRCGLPARAHSALQSSSRNFL